jgi:hypothetical protein
MGILVHLLDPEVFAELSEHDLVKLGAAIDKEIATNPELRRQLTGNLEKFLPRRGRGRTR